MVIGGMDSAGRLVRWRSGTTAAPSTAHSTIIRASVGVCIGSRSRVMHRSKAPSIVTLFPLLSGECKRMSLDDSPEPPGSPRKVPMRVPENPVLSPVRAGLSFVRVGLPATISRDWTGTLMIYIAVFVAGMIMTIAVLSLLAASIRYALDHDEPGQRA